MVNYWLSVDQVPIESIEQNTTTFLVHVVCSNHSVGGFKTMQNWCLLVDFFQVVWRVNNLSTTALHWFTDESCNLRE